MEKNIRDYFIVTPRAILPPSPPDSDAALRQSRPYARTQHARTRRETYGAERRKYILTAFGRILMGGPLSVLCLTASSFFSLCGHPPRSFPRANIPGGSK